MGTEAGNPNPTGLRFSGLDVPTGAEITDAYFEFVAYENDSGSANLKIQVQNTTNAAPFYAKPLSRSYLPDAVDWTPESWTAGQTYRTSNIATLIERVVADGDIDSNDTLAFLISGSGERVAHSFDSNAQNSEPRLVIEYDL